jgi:hypothetical protein
MTSMAGQAGSHYRGLNANSRRPVIALKLREPHYCLPPEAECKERPGPVAWQNGRALSK